MNSITLLSPAKINLILDVLGKRPDGYHEISSIMQPVNLFDEIRIELDDGSGIALECTGLKIPKGEENVAWRAAEVFLKESGLRLAVRIAIKKRIPIGAGLGGGSGNAAAVLAGMNRLTERFSDDELISLSPRIGADVVFFIHSRTAIAEGIGDIINPITSFPLFHYVLINPGFQVSTKRIYDLWDELENKNRAESVARMEHLFDMQRTVSLFRDGRFPLRNGLEDAAISLYPEIKELKGRFAAMGAEAVSMTGSGPTVFAVFRDEKKARRIYEYLKDGDKFVTFLTHGISGWHRL